MDLVALREKHVLRHHNTILDSQVHLPLVRRQVHMWTFESILVLQMELV